jgi:polyisoprenoid-binding protein YceI
MCGSCSLHRLLGRTVGAASLCLLTALGQAQAQTTWKVDPKASLVWWQIDPHMNHLWGTSCPQEPSWRPGEGRSGGWSTEEAMQAKAIHGFANVSDTLHIPLYPRRKVRFVCTETIRGEIALADTIKWRGAHGQIVIDVKGMQTGEGMRDAYQQHAILGSDVYRDIKFTLDSVVDMSRRRDTLHGTAVGTWELRGVTKPVSIHFTAYPEAGGIRVLGKFGMPVGELVTVYGIYKRNLGLGVLMGIWKTLFMGVDLLVRPQGTGAD